MKTFAKLTMAVAALSILGAAHASAFERDGIKVEATVKNSPTYNYDYKSRGLVRKAKPVRGLPGFSQDGVKIGGSVANATYVKHNSNLASGYEFQARQSIGTIHGTGNLKIGGSVANATFVERNVNEARGSHSIACQSIGSIGDQPGC